MVNVAALAVIVPLLILSLVIAARGHDATALAGVSVLGAGFAVLVGAIGGSPATDQVYDIGSTVILFCVLLMLGHLADAEGVFAWATSALVRGSGRSPAVMFSRVCLLAAATTAVLSANATIVLLAPVVVSTMAQLQLSNRPHTFACLHLANSGSLLMPVSNLTNLLAFAASGLSFLSFTGFMALPWLAAFLVAYLLLRRVFAGDLADQAEVTAAAELAPGPSRIPGLALSVLALTVVGFGVTSMIGIALVWPAAAGTVALAAWSLIRGTSTIAKILDSANVSFALFVVGLAVLIRGLNENGLGDVVAGILPADANLIGLLVVAVIAAVLAGLVNNLAATLVLAPAAALVGPPAVLAILIGVNIGANLSYPASLGNLSWRRTLAPAEEAPSAPRFITIGLMTAPLTLIAGTVALWGSVRLFG